MDAYLGAVTLSKLFLPPSEKGYTFKRKNLLPRGANSFLLKKTTFQNGTRALESKQKVTEVISLIQMVENLPSLYSPINLSTFNLECERMLNSEYTFAQTRHSPCCPCVELRVAEDHYENMPIQIY